MFINYRSITYRPYGTKEGAGHVFYKHIVPTKSTPNARLAFVGTEEKTIRITIRFQSDSSEILSSLKLTSNECHTRIHIVDLWVSFLYPTYLFRLDYPLVTKSLHTPEQIAMWGELCYTYYMLLCKRIDAQTLYLRNSK